jgi:hypothetical protein
MVRIASSLLTLHEVDTFSSLPKSSFARARTYIASKSSLNLAYNPATHDKVDEGVDLLSSTELQQ